MMFKSTYTSEYYKELHRYVHSMYRKRKGYITLKKLARNPLRVDYKDLRTGLATFYYIPTAFAQRLKLKGLVAAGS